MKLLKVSTSTGYKMLIPGFEVNFLTKTRVDKEAPSMDLLFLENGFPYPLETVFIGKNSSGKTTVLELVSIVLQLLSTGRIAKDSFSNETPLGLDVLFYEKGLVFHYSALFVSDVSNPSYLVIKSESLSSTKIKPSYRKDLSNAHYSVIRGFVPNEGGDTSSVCKWLDAGFNSSFFVSEINGAKLSRCLEVLLFVFGAKTTSKMIRLFDDSIEYIKMGGNEGNEKKSFIFKRVNEEPMLVTVDYLMSHLSGGTIRGIVLYGHSILAFAMGGHVVVDEIEINFNKNLIGNLILMFNDPSINKKGASLIYSTHYSELLDETNRCDNINVLHRDGSRITLKNMHVDYATRTDMRRSAQFDQNAFDNLVNYDRLMELKKELRGHERDNVRREV